MRKKAFLFAVVIVMAIKIVAMTQIGGVSEAEMGEILLTGFVLFSMLFDISAIFALVFFAQRHYRALSFWVWISANAIYFSLPFMIHAAYVIMY